MKKFLKITGVLLATLLVFSIVIFSLLVTLVDPNRFKPVIETQVAKMTGRPFTISGNLSWTLFPYLGVNAGHLSLGNPEGFQNNFLEANKVTLGVKVLPLLHGAIESSGVTLDGVKITLRKKANGQINWDFKPKNAVNTNENMTTANSNPDKLLGLAIAGVNITNSSLIFIDEKTNQETLLKNFELHADNVNLFKPFAVKGSFTFDKQNLSGKISYSTNVQLDIQKQQYLLNDIAISSILKQDNKKFNIETKANGVIDLTSNSIRLTNWQEKIENLSTKGEMSIQNFRTNPEVRGQLHIEPFDLKAWLAATHQPIEGLQKCEDVNGDVNFSFNSANKTSAIQGANSFVQAITATGNLKIASLELNKIKLSNVFANMHLQNGMLTLDPITGDLYEGTVKGKTQVNLRGQIPQVNLQATINNVQASQIMDDLSDPNRKIKVEGRANVTLNVTTGGENKADILKNLNGNSVVAFNQGILHGMDLPYYLDTASAILNNDTNLSVSNSDKTDFGNLTATFTIQNGIISNQDLKVDSPRFVANGSGTVDLTAQKIDYVLNVKANPLSENQQTHKVKLYGESVPILIKGNVSDPHVRVDTNAVLKTVAEVQLKKHKKQIEEKIEGAAGQILQNILGQ